jgi:hypothetical protein
MAGAKSPKRLARRLTDRSNDSSVCEGVIRAHKTNPQTDDYLALLRAAW